MKRTISALGALLFFACGFAQQRKGHFRISDENASHQLYVCLDNNLSDTKQQTFQIPEIKDLAEQYQFTLEKVELISEAKRVVFKAKALDVSALERLNHIFKVKVNGSNIFLAELAQKLEALNAVNYCSLISSKPIPPPGDILPMTPNYQNLQAYIGVNPGVNIQYAWNLGLTGSGIKIRDVEYGFNKSHEEFNDVEGAFMASGMTISPSAINYLEHGTAVYGVVYADYGTYGVSGLAHGAQEMVLYPEWQETGYDRINAIAQAINGSDAGDVIIYEIQAYGQNNNFVPAEFENLVWDLTKAATDAGIIIVAAAGNGSQNLDSDYYSDYMNWGDSGAIIVGGGKATIAHEKISYSTYGSRVNVQGWSENVMTSGVGEYSIINNDPNQKYTRFNGTSAATPMVASCVIVLQSYYHTLTGNYLSPNDMRDLLIETGIAQGSGGHIGPIPNMETAISAINSLAIETMKTNDFLVFPNPATDKITIVGGETPSATQALFLNALGQVVYRQEITSNGTLDLSTFANGVYFLKIEGNRTSYLKKIIKK